MQFGVLLGKGDGAFQHAQEDVRDQAFSPFTGSRVSDFNGDGHAGVAVTDGVRNDSPHAPGDGNQHLPEAAVADQRGPLWIRGSLISMATASTDLSCNGR